MALRRLRKLLAWGLALVFLMSGVLKVLSPVALPRELLEAVAGVVGLGVAQFVLERLALFDIVLGVAIIVPEIRRIGAAVSVVYLITGAFILGLSWEPGLPFPGCGCFGQIGEALLPIQDVRLSALRNIVLSFFGIIVTVVPGASAIIQAPSQISGEKER